jgi:hypothetical protein
MRCPACGTVLALSLLIDAEAEADAPEHEPYEAPRTGAEVAEALEAQRYGQGLRRPRGRAS